MCSRGLHRFANPPYLGRFPFSALPRVAPYCVPGGVRVVSISPFLLPYTGGVTKDDKYRLPRHPLTGEICRIYLFDRFGGCKALEKKGPGLRAPALSQHTECFVNASLAS